MAQVWWILWKLKLLVYGKNPPVFVSYSNSWDLQIIVMSLYWIFPLLQHPWLVWLLYIDNNNGIHCTHSVLSSLAFCSLPVRLYKTVCCEAWCFRCGCKSCFIATVLWWALPYGIFLQKNMFLLRETIILMVRSFCQTSKMAKSGGAT